MGTVAVTREQKAIKASLRKLLKGKKYCLSFFEGSKGTGTIHLLGGMGADEARVLLRDSGLFWSVDYQHLLDNFSLRWVPLSGGVIWRVPRGNAGYEEPWLEHDGVMLPFMYARGERAYFGTHKHPVSVERMRYERAVGVGPVYNGSITWGEDDLNALLDQRARDVDSARYGGGSNLRLHGAKPRLTR